MRSLLVQTEALSQGSASGQVARRRYCAQLVLRESGRRTWKARLPGKLRACPA